MGYDEQAIEDLFGQHKMSPEEFEKFEEIKNEFRLLALRTKELVPDGPLQTTAINKLFEAKNCATVGYLTHLIKSRRG